MLAHAQLSFACLFKNKLLSFWNKHFNRKKDVLMFSFIFNFGIQTLSDSVLEVYVLG